MSEYGELKSNMSESQLFELLLEFTRSCDICNVSHKECRVVPSCKECQTGFWIRMLRRHFGMQENEGC